MGIRFRKSLKIAPGIKLNLSKSGLGLTAGVKGAHISANTSGRVTKSVGVPGTGISHVTTSTIGKGKKAPKSNIDKGIIDENIGAGNKTADANEKLLASLRVTRTDRRIKVESIVFTISGIISLLVGLFGGLGAGFKVVFVLAGAVLLYCGHAYRSAMKWEASMVKNKEAESEDEL